MQDIAMSRRRGFAEVTVEWMNSLVICATSHYKLGSCSGRPSCARLKSITQGPGWKDHSGITNISCVTHWETFGHGALGFLETLEEFKMKSHYQWTLFWMFSSQRLASRAPFYQTLSPSVHSSIQLLT